MRASGHAARALSWTGSGAGRPQPRSMNWRMPCCAAQVTARPTNSRLLRATARAPGQISSISLASAGRWRSCPYRRSSSHRPWRRTGRPHRSRGFRGWHSAPPLSCCPLAHRKPVPGAGDAGRPAGSRPASGGRPVSPARARHGDAAALGAGEGRRRVSCPRRALTTGGGVLGRRTASAARAVSMHRPGRGPHPWAPSAAPRPGRADPVPS